ncbi:hypothetical protein QQ056_13130 [Oscillatoria laete-virens NRMC-F 0139]|nr:hypothetical protein [Oscillatoria laete-virens]MDL5054481.1 hypothetical protein [Oscillatoria laete-virens NRMC-F 0139]
MPSSSRLTTHVFERLPSWILGGLIVVWSLAGMMGLRNALMAGFIALGVAQFARNQDRRFALKPGWLWIVAGVLFLQVTISLIFSIDRGYSSHRWWADYTAPLLLAFSAAQFARTLNYRFLFFCFGAGLLLNGSYDLFQVFTHPGTESWKGFFSDYGWQNGYLLLTLPLGILLLRADTNDAFPRWFPALFSLSFFLALTASLSSWARANQLCFLAVMVPSIAILICQHGTETGFKKKAPVDARGFVGGGIVLAFYPGGLFSGGSDDV